MTAPTISDADRTAFARNGFLVLPDAVDPGLIDQAYKVVAAHVPEDLSDVETLVDGPADRHYWDDLPDMTPFYRLNEQLRTVAASLVGEGRLTSGADVAQVALRYPTGETPRDPDHRRTSVDGNAHVDVVGPDGEDIRPFAIAATTYLADVYPRGGGLTVWPGTHWRVDDHLGEHGFGAGANGIAEAVVGDVDPFEVTGPRGTVVLWHPLVVHTGGQHLGRNPRVATFTRFGREDEIEYTRRHGDPFDGWDGVSA